MPSAVEVEVEFVAAEDTWELRRRVLRNGNMDADVDFPEDRVPGAFHLAASIDGRVVGVASFSPQPAPGRPSAVAYQLRGMAVLADVQGSGVGRRLLDAAVEELRRQRAAVLWANARDSALGFYERLGMTVVGDGFVNPAGIPHHVVIRDL